MVYYLQIEHMYGSIITNKRSRVKRKCRDEAGDYIKGWTDKKA